VTVRRTWFPLTGPVSAVRRAGAVPAAGAAAPIDPLTGPRLALAGRVATMDDAFTVKNDAIVYVDKGRIVAVQAAQQAPPVGFEETPVVETRGTLFPGLIELHNHLSYNALPLWLVPKRFTHRGQWPNHKDYRPLISGPMTVIGEYRDAQGKPSLLPALIRYVECKCLLGGVTTSQGVKLASNSGIQRFYRGIVRNVEQTDDVDLPEAQARIPDMEARNARAFLNRLAKEDSCFLLHLSEGVTDPAEPLSVARRHFRALEVAQGTWALAPTFTGIHAAGLLPEDFDVLAAHEASIVWSPFSNLLLYGGTARVEAAKAAGVTVGLGSDWSPTGSKNLLGELKIAWLYNQHALAGLFKARELVAMATRDAARILKWDAADGVIAAGQRADLLVIDGSAADPYDALIRARETDIRLVMINGIARYGTSSLMDALSPRDQTVRVGGQSRRLFLEQETSDEAVAPVSLSTATATLRKALRDIAKLAKEAEKPRKVAARRSLDAPEAPVWSLALDELRDTGVELRPRLPFDGPRDLTGPPQVPARAARAAASAPLSTILGPITLDPLTVADDDAFLTLVEKQPNVPEEIRRGLRQLY
jgi:5-methylthioadenosine/S-adenosylhomocysteine deaminase